MDSLKSLIENTVNVFFAALATAIAGRIVSGRRKKGDKEEPPASAKTKGWFFSLIIN
ncbi:hypothetical protein ACQKP0_05025 [Heyndrickxia sp. NPDC080065]|uniref:hypothetical protein n=1 Tax=Heyndrickxia sp. NPDC080065 TaxID=3390568 RepID=UPI003CFDAEA0